MKNYEYDPLIDRIIYEEIPYEFSRDDYLALAAAALDQAEVPTDQIYDLISREIQDKNRLNWLDD